MTKYLWIKELVENGEYQDAYDEYSKIIEQNLKAYDAYFERALIDCYFLRAYYEVSREDLLLVFKNNKRLAKRIPMFLTIICDSLKDFDNAIYFGELALQDNYITPEENLLEVHFALSRSYYLRGSSIEDYTSALNEIDECTKISDELNDELLLCKCDILLVLERFDEVLEIVNHLFFTTTIIPVYYYFKARALYGLANEKQDFEKALDNFNYYLEYEPNDYYSLIYKANCLKSLNLIDEAIKVYENLKNDNNEEDVVSEIIKTYEQNGSVEEAIRYAEEYLKEHSSWQVKYSLAMVFVKRATTLNDLNTAKMLLEDSYLQTKNEIIAESLIQVYRRLGLDEDNYRFLKTLVSSSTDGRFAYYLAIEAFRYKASYEETEKYLKLAYDLKYFTETEYIDMVMSFTKEPKKYFKKIKKYSEKFDQMYFKMGVPFHSIGTCHKLASRYLYGMYGAKPNLDKAIKYAKGCYELLSNDCCMAILYGRCLEIARRYKEAFEVYKKANEQTKQAFRPLCQCSYGYLAHAYIKGIGTEIDIEQAKELILEGISQYQEKTDGSVLAIYAYFALKEEKGFSKEKAIEYLSKDSSFALYDVSRYKLLMMLDKDNQKKWQNMLNISLKYDAIMAVNHYKKHKDDEVYYPFLNNY
ncbi:MAG: hypothetical protein IJX78_06580 [Bacilli bacterium]|nr:hypothetical protein [Bacilli bacterium]